jgi:hypothetical protein
LLVENDVWGGTIGSELQLMSHLTFLALVNTSLGGAMSDVDWSALPNLVFLDFDINKLSGSVPPSINSLSKLTVLSAVDNAITGTLPPLTSLSMLSFFSVHNNEARISQCAVTLDSQGDADKRHNPARAVQLWWIARTRTALQQIHRPNTACNIESRQPAAVLCV